MTLLDDWENSWMHSGIGIPKKNDVAQQIGEAILDLKPGWKVEVKREVPTPDNGYREVTLTFSSPIGERRLPRYED